MNGGGFALHGITHFSASSANSAASCFAAWILERLLNKRVPVGAAAHRGTAAEHGVVLGLFDPKLALEDCQWAALKKFDELTALSGDPNREKERAAVAPIVEIALGELRQYGIPTATQRRIEKPLGDGLPPLLGFADLVWDNHGIILDIKTTLRLPSETSAAHARQVAGYVHGTNHEGRVGYFTNKKHGVYRVEDADRRFNELVNIARRIDRFLALSKDPWELASLVIPDADHYFFSDPRAAQNRAEVYGI